MVNRDTWEPKPEELQRFFLYMASEELKKATRHRQTAERWRLRAEAAKTMEGFKNSSEISDWQIPQDFT